MTVGPIPMSKIREHLRNEMGLDDAEYDRARAIIRMMDNAYLGMLNRRRDEPEGLSSSAKVTDTAGVKRVLDSLGSKAGAARPRKTK